MGKTDNDKEYERGIHDGQRGGFLDDIIQANTESGSPYDKGYKYGATHRYGPEGRYHTSDGRGSNDPKDSSSSGAGVGGRGGGDDGDRDEGGGGGSYGGDSGGGGGGGGGFLVGSVIVILLIGFVIHIFDTKVIPRIETDVIKRIYPAYETRSDRIIRQKQEIRPTQERWEHFISNSDQWLKAPESSLFLPGKIIFISSENGDGEIFLADPNGRKRPVNLTHRFAGNIVAAAPSIDGKKIAFIANQKGVSGIYVMSSDGTRIIQVCRTVDGSNYTELVWVSPYRILTTRQNHPYVKTIWEVKIDYSARVPSPPTMIIPSYEEYNGKWVEEGRKQHFTFYSCDSPTISRDDKKRIIYIKKEYRGSMTHVFQSKAQIIVRDLQTIPVKDSIIDAFGAALSPQAWSPCGDKVVFHLDKDLIGILELSSSQIHWLDITGRNPAWSLAPGGRGKKIDSGTAYKSSTAWTSGKKEANLTVPGRNPAWSPDGKWIAFDNEDTIYAVEVASGNVRKIVGPRFLGKSATNPLWVQ